MAWRLGIDLGTNSLGWCALELDPDGSVLRILAMGSRIFSDGRDPKSGASLAVDRRAARAMRRRGDRFLRRQQALLKHLTAAGLFPADEAERKALESLDPFELRARGLDEALPPHHLGRAFFHLNQRRGFKSNRKADRGAEDEAGKVAVGIDRLKAAIAESGARTFGEFLHLRRKPALERQGLGRHNEIPSVRTRLRPETGEDARGDGYDFYPGRQLVQDEFDALFEVQAAFHPDLLTPSVHDRLFEVIFHQRPLKQPRIGKCTLIATEERLPKAHPLFQRRRLLEEVNALMLVRPGEVAERLTRDQRDVLLLRLGSARKVKFEALRNILKLDPDARFNKESENRPELAGDEIAAQLADKKRFGPRWLFLSPDEQWAIVRRLMDEEDNDALLAWLQAEHGLDEAHAKAVAGIHLPEGFGRFGETASRKLIEALQNGEIDGRVVVYSEAVELAGLGHHSDFRTGEAFDELPYYGAVLERHLMPGTGEPADPEELRIGRLTNPTVHIGLNQLRRTVNRLIATYGPPDEIAIELARELKMSDEQKKEINKQNNDNRRDAEQRSEKLRDIGKPDTGANRALLKLWEELNPGNVLDRRCIYSGRQIGIDMLFDGSVEVDHILPFTDTFDDSNGNKILCTREANRRKRKQSPYKAFGGDPAEWEEIAARAARLPKSKRWRFEPDAMQRFDKEGGFIARQLTDTQHLARLAREYLSALYPGRGEESSHVWVSPGRLTEMVRRKLGLNELLPDHNYAGNVEQEKNRLDHRHHAIDAFVIGIVDRSMLQKIARASGLEGEAGRERIIIPDPWEGFRDELRAVVNAITVSHRVDHGTVSKAGLRNGHDQTAGRLHNDTAYGFTGGTDTKGNTIVVRRVPLTALKAEQLAADSPFGVREPVLRAALRAFTAGKDFAKALNDFPKLGPLPFRRVRHVRVIEPLSVIPVRDKSGRAYKGYKGDSNYRYDVWELPDGRWQAEVVSMFDAHQPGWLSAVRSGCPTAKKVLCLQQNDLVAIERDGGERELMRVVKFGQNGQITLAAPQEAGDLKRRDAAPNDVDPFKYSSPTAGGLKKLRTRQVRIDEIGRVDDPGFPARKKVRRTRSKLAVEG